MLRYALYLTFVAIFFTGGCATLQPDFETPTVNLTSIKALEAEGLSPKFEIGLHIINPNRSSLELQGVVCTLEVQGYDLLTGVAKDLPLIEGYSEGDVTVTATTSLLKSIRLIADVAGNQRDTIAYKMKAKLDLGGLYPVIHVEEKGEINLTGPSR